MKRLIILFLAITLLCGCSKNRHVTPVMSDISFTAQIDYNKQEYNCDVTLCNDSLNLTVNEPQEIKGLTLKMNKNGTVAEFMGVSYDLDINSLPYGAVADILLQVFNDVSNNELDVKEENCETTGNVNGIDYTFKFSPAGLPLLLSINKPNIIVKFSNVTIK